MIVWPPLLPRGHGQGKGVTVPTLKILEIAKRWGSRVNLIGHDSSVTGGPDHPDRSSRSIKTSECAVSSI
jgi:hypothetical protein